MYLALIGVTAEKKIVFFKILINYFYHVVNSLIVRNGMAVSLSSEQR